MSLCRSFCKYDGILCHWIRTVLLNELDWRLHINSFQVFPWTLTQTSTLMMWLDKFVDKIQKSVNFNMVYPLFYSCSIFICAFLHSSTLIYRFSYFQLTIHTLQHLNCNSSNISENFNSFGSEHFVCIDELFDYKRCNNI